MICRNVREVLSAYLDDQLSASEALAIAAHLESCASCRDELEGLLFTSRLVSSLALPTLSVDLASTVVARASASSWSKGWKSLQTAFSARRAFVAGQLVRAVALAGLFLLAAAGPRASGNVIATWPGRVGEIAAVSTACLTGTLAQAARLLQEESSGSSLSRRPASSGKHRSASPNSRSGSPARIPPEVSGGIVYV